MSNIKNSTIAKLTYEEVGELGLLNKGIMTYTGTLKSRKQGFKTEKISEYQTNFVNDGYRFEFIKLQPVDDSEQLALRVYDIKNECYCPTYVFGLLVGIEFLKH
jgi:hypothetical protein